MDSLTSWYERAMEKSSFFGQIKRLIFNQGWARLLVVEKSDHSDVVKIRESEEITESRDPDTVGLYSESDFETGKMNMKIVQHDCRNFLIDKNLIR